LRVLILGCGAIGGYFGGRLQESGVDVTFLVREQRQGLLHANGLSIESPFGDALLEVKTLTKATLDTTFDLIVLSCKSYDLDDAIETIRPAVGSRTLILPLLNGLLHYPILDKQFNIERVLGGFCYLSVTMAEKGHILHLSQSHTLTLGARHRSQTIWMELFSEILSTANLDVNISDDIYAELWAKFTFLCAAAAANCLMRGSIGSIINTQFGRQVITNILEECHAVATANGYPPLEEARQSALKILTEIDSPFETSMYKDMKSNHRTEFRHIIGDMIKKAETAGLYTPYLIGAFTHIEVYENTLNYI
jgi:2-dehydropantoate 2-reductase